MGLFDWFKRKDNRANHSFTDEDREHSREIRKQKLEILQAEKELKLLEIQREKELIQQDIQDLIGDDEEEQSPFEKMLIPILQPMLMKMNNPQSQQVQESPHYQNNNSFVSSPELVGNTLSNDELQILWNKLPENYKKYVKRMNDEELRVFIISQVPAINRETIQRAINLIHSN